MRGSFLIARETVAVETPAQEATSLMLTAVRCHYEAWRAEGMTVLRNANFLVLYSSVQSPGAAMYPCRAPAWPTDGTLMAFGTPYSSSRSWRLRA